MRKLRTIMSGLAVAAALTLTGGATANNQPACAAANCAGYCECVWQCSASGQGGLPEPLPEAPAQGRYLQLWR